MGGATSTVLGPPKLTPIAEYLFGRDFYDLNAAEPYARRRRVRQTRHHRPAFERIQENSVSDAPSPWQQRFSDLYQPLDDQHRHALDQTLASHALEGLQPDRDSVADLVALLTGAIDEQEYDQRSDRWAAQPKPDQ